MVGDITLTSRVRVSDAVVSRDLEGESVLLNLASGVYFGLDPVGTRIWHLLNEPWSLPEILDALVDEFEVARGQCERDLLHFIGLLREKALIDTEVSG